MFEKLFDIIIHFLNDIMPFKVVNQWEKGILLRLGRFKRTVNPGLNFKIPFIDQIMSEPVITQTVNLKSQTVTSLDQKCIVLSSIVRYHNFYQI